MHLQNVVFTLCMTLVQTSAKMKEDCLYLYRRSIFKWHNIFENKDDLYRVIWHKMTQYG